MFVSMQKSIFEWLGCEKQQDLYLNCDRMFTPQHVFVWGAAILTLCLGILLFMEIKLVLGVTNLLVTGHIV